MSRLGVAGVIVIDDPDAPLVWNPDVKIQKKYDKRYRRVGWIITYTPPEHRTRVSQFRHTHDLAIQLADEIIDDSNRYVNGKDPYNADV